MSWDVWIVNDDQTFSSLEDIPNQYVFPPLCEKKELIEIVEQIFLGAQLSKDGYCCYENEQYSIEFYLKDDLIDSLTLNIRGGGNPLPKIKKLCEIGTWRAIDTSTGCFLDQTGYEKSGFDEWQAFNNQIAKYIMNNKKHWWQFWK